MATVFFGFKIQAKKLNLIKRLAEAEGMSTGGYMKSVLFENLPEVPHSFEVIDRKSGK